MKIVLFYIVLLCILIMNVYSGGEILINGTIRACPLFYEPQYNIVGIDLGTSWLLGYHKNLYTIGLKASFDYTLYDNMNTSEIVQGTWLHTRILLDQAYAITPGFQAKWAAGFIWLNNNIKYNTTEMQTTDFYGISFDFDLLFLLPGRFLMCEITNRIDLLYALNPDFHLYNMAPHYYGGLRFYIDFGITWFQMYLEAKGQYWNYTDPLYKISTGIASGGAGICLNLPPINLKKKDPVSVDPLHTDDITGNINTNSTTNITLVEEKEGTDPAVEKLKTVMEGNMVQFNNILFAKYTDELLPVSYPILDQVTDVLKQREGIRFSISAYAEYQENPVAEFKLYTSRAKKIKEYLIQGGIDEYRLKVSSIGQIITPKNQNTGSTVVFKAVHEKVSAD